MLRHPARPGTADRRSCRCGAGGNDSGGRLKVVAPASSPSQGGSRSSTAPIAASSSSTTTSGLTAGGVSRTLPSPSLRRTVRLVSDPDPAPPVAAIVETSGGSGVEDPGATGAASPGVAGAGASLGRPPAPASCPPPSEQAPASSATTSPAIIQCLRSLRMSHHPPMALPAWTLDDSSAPVVPERAEQSFAGTVRVAAEWVPALTGMAGRGALPGMTGRREARRKDIRKPLTRHLPAVF